MKSFIKSLSEIQTFVMVCNADGAVPQKDNVLAEPQKTAYKMTFPNKRS